MLTSARRSCREWVARHRFATTAVLAIWTALILARWATIGRGPGNDPLQAGLARLDQSLGEFRPIEARLSGAPYRPVIPVTRAAAPGTDAPLDVREASNAVERAALSTTPAAGARALAKMYLVTGRLTMRLS